MATSEKKNVKTKPEPARKESEMERPGLQKYRLGDGVWTKEHEEFVRYLTEDSDAH